MRVMRLVIGKKTHIFSNYVYSAKKTFSQDLVFLFSFFSKNFFKCVFFFTFESCLSLIMASGSQLKVKTNNSIYHINSSCRVFYYKYNIAIIKICNLNYLYAVLLLYT